VSRKETDTISQLHIPKYIIDDISTENNPELNIRDITSFKSGIKIGSKLRNSNHKWVEKWFDMSCKDVKMESSKAVNVMDNNAIKPKDQDIIIRYYSKIWVNPEENIIEGESCYSVFVDGSKQGVDEGLAFTLTEKFKCDNVLKGNLKRNPRIHWMQCYITEYDQSVFKIKLRDDGVEHKWTSFP
jgi:hypothetical protein